MKVLVHLPPSPLSNLNINEAYKIVSSLPSPPIFKLLVDKAFLTVCPGLIVTLPEQLGT